MSTDTGKGNGARRVTLRDIAKQLDISHATVSRALNSATDPFISQATRDRVRKTAAEMGYRPNHAARTLSTGRTGLLALWLWAEQVPGSYHSAVGNSMLGAARSHGYQLLLDLLSRNSDHGVPMVGFDRWHVDGIVAYESGPAVEAQLRTGIPSPVPIVSVGSYHLLEGVDHVFIDLREALEESMRHLIKSGRRRIVYVTDDLANRGGEIRYMVYVAMMAEAGLATEFLEIAPNRRAARVGARDFIDQSGVPDAFYCHNDDFAIGAYRGLCDLGVKVPDDVAIVGCDGIEDGEYLEVPLTTVVQPVAKVCELACQFLERRIEEPTLSIQSAVVKADFIVRDSSQTPS
jgi:DNA-binding LacI/PurR family transcriptional regulator